MRCAAVVFLLSHNSVNELCYVAQFINSIVTSKKNAPLNVAYSNIRYQNDDIFKNSHKKQRCRNFQAFKIYQKSISNFHDTNHLNVFIRLLLNF
jgi:hypothetical protein